MADIFKTNPQKRVSKKSKSKPKAIIRNDYYLESKKKEHHISKILDEPVLILLLSVQLIVLFYHIYVQLTSANA